MTMHVGAAHLREVGQKCLALPGVVDADVIDPDQRTDAPLLSVVVGPDYDRVPPRVLSLLSDNDCGVYDVSIRADHFIVLGV